MTDSSTPENASGGSGTPPAAPEDAATTEKTADTAAPTASEKAETRSEKLEKGNRRFTRWRKQRAFGAGLLMILSGVVILVPTYLSLEISNIQIQISTLGGVSTLVIGILLIVCGLMTWFRGEGRILTGVAAMILGIVALPQSNFGGFVIGTMLALIGGALALAWTPESKEEAKSAKQEKKDTRAAKKAAKKGEAAKAVLAVVGAVSVGVALHSPQAQAQLPQLPDLQIPGLTPPAQNDQDNGAGAGDGQNDGNAQDGGDAPAAPQLPSMPELPQLPELPKPEVPPLTLPDGNELQDQLDGGLDALGVEIPGLNVAPPPPLEGLPITGNTFTITADRTEMTPNMKMSYVTVDTQQGPKKALRIDSDRTVLQNLQTQFLAPNGGQSMRQDTQGQTTILSGNFHIVVKKITMTLEMAGINTAVPITIDADWAPDDIAKELSKLGVGLPDLLSGKTAVLNASMDTYLVSADKLEAPTNDIHPW